MADPVKITDPIIVSELARRLNIEVAQLMTQLFKDGLMLTLNDPVDFETAQQVVGELDLGVELVKEAESDNVKPRSKRQMQTEAGRPPVIAVMGHVDHGKTSLLDAIRGDKVVEREAGGITQHISAYQVKHNGRAITFLDTPGHEAFSALRQHGAALTDLAIIVVAADDGVKPQTKEAIRFASQAGVKIMVAINKTDLPTANIPKVLQELNDAGLVTEQWGGDTVVVEVSAKTKAGIDKLLDMALLITDVEELKADSSGPAEGIVIEGHMETGRGPVVTLLVEHGQLKKGDYISAGNSYGKIRTVEDHKGQTLDLATASMPAVVSGMRTLPDFGAVFHVHHSEKEAKSAGQSSGANQPAARIAASGQELLARIHKDRVGQGLPVVVRADVRGSATSVIESLQVLGDEEVSVRVINSGVGNITENDVRTAAAAGGIVYGFSVDVPVSVKRLAHREGVPIRVYKVIYELIDDVKTELEAMLQPKVVEHELGRLQIKGVFKISKNNLICGGEVTKGKVVPGAIAHISRDKEELGEAQVVNVQKGQQDVKEAVMGDVCGLNLKTESKINLKIGDRLDFVERESVTRTIGGS